MSEQTLLPPNASDLERATEGAIRARLTAVPIPLATLWNPDTCPQPLLPWLAWALSVDQWSERWPVAIQRDVIRQSYEIHSLKGTVYSLRHALRTAGHGECDLQEGLDAGRYDGQIRHNATHYYGPNPGYWARYRVTLAEAQTIYEAAQVKRLLADLQPARSELVSLAYHQLLSYDASRHHDGQVTHGVVGLTQH